MPSPQNSPQSTVTPATASNANSIASLLTGVKWGGATATGVALTYSFPLSSSPIAVWATNPYYFALSDETSTAFALTAAQQTASEAAIASWAAVADVALTETTDTAVNVGDVRFAWTTKTIASAGGRNAVAWTYDPEGFLARAGDVWLSRPMLGSEPTSSWNAGGWGYVTLIHELGHALGLKHSFEGSSVLPSSQELRQYTVMSYNAHPHGLFVKVAANPDGSYTANSTNVEPDTPMLYDIAAIQYLYGANTSYRTGNDVYSFDPGVPFIRTLWDAGGIDTISVANFTKGCIIDLQAGHFSKITIESDPIPAGVRWTAAPPIPTFDGTDDLVIAYDTTIENAVGGSGSDALIGNNADNSLTGGAGSDTLTGGTGNDTLDGGGGDDTAVFSGTRNSYTITVGTGGAITLWDARTGNPDGTDTITSVENFQFSDVTLLVSSVADTTPPSVNSFVPADEAVGVAVNANIVLNFSESVQRGAGNIILKKADGAIVETFSTATGGNLSFSGVTLAIDPSASLAAGTAYKVEFVSGAVKDLAGNAYAGTTSYNFTTGTYVNRSPTGSVAIVGTPVQGQTLTASNTITDSDGLGTVTYQWMANNGTAWTSLATGSTFTLTDAQVGNQIRVLASYTDGQGSAEAVGSPTTTTVARSAGSLGRLISGTAGSDSLSGGPGDTVQGGLGNDTLDGGAGNSTLAGGAGNDMYLISGPGIVISENSSEGTDWVRTSLSAYISSANVENLVYTGSISFSGTGTGLDNMIIGGPGDDTLDGGFGNDILSGGAGNDIFVLNSAGDVVNESANEGIDTVKTAAFSYVLGPNIENLVYTGASAFTGYGNELANAITGGPGRDLLRGGIGNDTIDGGAVLDTAVYSGKRSDYTIAKNANGSYTVADKRATALTSDGTDNLINVERLRFSDENVALDLDGSGGTVAKILGIVFGATTATEKQYVGYGLMLLDGGMSNDDLMKLALDARLGKGFTNESAIRLIYQNLLGSAPSQSEIGYYSALIATQQYTQAALALVAADTSLNSGNIHLTGLAATGLEYLPTA